jgi:GNAT superfamily N-acetyltransferase
MNFLLRPAIAEDIEFAFEAKRDAIGPHVTVRWGWDETFQREHHQKRWGEKPWQVIVFDEKTVGTVSIDVQPTHLRFGEFYILQPYRGQGLGTRVLAQALQLADEHHLETRLEYLKWNPVASLYARHGFSIVGENEIHYFLTRPPHKFSSG